jgi:hypothetical protein
VPRLSGAIDFGIAVLGHRHVESSSTVDAGSCRRRSIGCGMADASPQEMRSI